MRERGFSLMEVLAALALLALLLLGVYSGVSSTTYSVRRGTSTVARLDELRAAREFLRRELVSATALPWKLDEHTTPVVFEGDEVSFRFVAVLPGYLGTLGPQVIAVSREDDGEGGHGLAVRLAPLPISQSTLADGTQEILLGHVRSLRVRYAKRGSAVWLDQWDTPMELPASIEVSLVPEEGAPAWPPLVVSPRQDIDAINVRGAARSLGAGR